MSTRQTILIVEDNPKTVETIRLYLTRSDFDVRAVTGGREALDLLNHDEPNLVVLDWMIPELDGIEVCRRIRRRSRIPILLLTAKTRIEDKLLGLESGADDYLTKPFSPRELVARARALLRRAGSTLQPSRFLDLFVDPDRRIARLGSEPLSLTPTEFELLSILVKQPERVFRREEILKTLFGWTYDGGHRVVDGHVKNLRRKIRCRPGEAPVISTVFGVGYKLTAGEGS